MVVSGLAAALIVVILGSFILRYTGADEEVLKKPSFTVDHVANTFLLDGEPFQYISGSFHYFRAHPRAWQKRLRTMKAAGLNVIDTYVEWSLHNPHDGVYEWSKIANVERFLELAQAEGFYVILRPGPYICAERDNGGLPHWLFTKYPGIQLRTNDANYTHEVAVWYSKLMPRMERFLRGNGGPIIMVQVENEYGAFHACDHDYLNWLRDETLKYVHDKALLFTTDIPNDRIKCGKIEGVFATTDFGFERVVEMDNLWKILRSVQPTGPLVNSEFYPGWLTHWQEENQRRDPKLVAEGFRKLLEAKVNVNFYMFFGGTNFGFTAGANNFGDTKYTPDITSYDYDAVMDEMGNVTKKYEMIRDVIKEFREIPKVEVIQEQAFAYGRVEMSPVMNLLSSEARAILAKGKTRSSLKPMTFEELDQYSGLILYETNLSGIVAGQSYVLTLNDLRDRALVYIDQQFKGILSRQNAKYSLTLNDLRDSKLQLLVENQGRINFDIANDTKGILGAVTIQPLNADKVLILNDWLNTAFPLEEPEVTDIWTGVQNNSLTFMENDTSGVLDHGPIIYYGEFIVTQEHHTYLNPTGWGKGVAFVNGFNIGRYWPVAGPQITLYVPQEILHKGRNSLVLIEYQQTNRADVNSKPYITLDDTAQLDAKPQEQRV
ncbi:beta-galactosidase [Musca vetustissima]|uniref:beta-galactosidase n=1 Tax=Musca vetustissima TaxID=27455 RepID=UPI002AB73485|nr:beta-galactosidase [Musca vetustissima]